MALKILNCHIVYVCLVCHVKLVWFIYTPMRVEPRRGENCLFTLFTFVFASNSKVLISISDGWNLWYFKLKSIRIHSFKYQDLRHWVAKILGLKNHSMWQKLNSFVKQCNVRCYLAEQIVNVVCLQQEQQQQQKYFQTCSNTSQYKIYKPFSRSL